MNRVPYASGIGSIAYAVIFDRSKIFQMPREFRRKKGIEPNLIKMIKQLSRTI